MRTIITERDVHQYRGGETLYAGEHAGVTDLARETARLSGVTIVFGPPPAAPQATDGGGAKLCVNLPDKGDATYVVKVHGDEVSIYEQTGDRLTLRESRSKRICRHP